MHLVPRKILLEEGMAAHSIFVPGESHVQRSPAGSPKGDKELLSKVEATEHEQMHKTTALESRQYFTKLLRSSSLSTFQRWEKLSLKSNSVFRWKGQGLISAGFSSLNPILSCPLRLYRPTIILGFVLGLIRKKLRVSQGLRNKAMTLH